MASLCVASQLDGCAAPGKGVGVAQLPVTVEPVHPGFDAAVLDDLGRRLSAVRLAPGDGTAWEQGVPRPWLTSLLARWQQFDIGAFQARLDQLAHVRASCRRSGDPPGARARPGAGAAAAAADPRVAWLVL